VKERGDKKRKERGDGDITQKLEERLLKQRDGKDGVCRWNGTANWRGVA
jgi:hypothetical protein